MDGKLKALVADIKKLFGDAKIYLFGSRARGKPTKDSDYDIIVISKRFSKVDFVDRPAIIWKNSWVGIAADLLCYTPQEFKRISKTSSVVSDAMTYAVPL